jgi:hypothetical protein
MATTKALELGQLASKVNVDDDIRFDVDLTFNYTGFDSDIASKTTNDLTEGDNLYYTLIRDDSAFDVRLTTKTTDDLAEGDNLYYLTSRADSDAKNAVSAIDAEGDGSFSYDNATGIFTYTGPSPTEVRAHMVAGTGVFYDSAPGVISVGQPIGIADNVTFAELHVTADLTVNGSLTVDGDVFFNGTQTAVSSNTLQVKDPMIHLADSNEFSDTLDIGIIAHYSDDAGSTHKHTGIIRDASNSQWYLFNGLVQDGLDNASPDVEVNIGSTGWELSTLNAGRYIGIYDGFDSDLATKTTDDLTEGTRLYYTTTRADSDFDVRLAIKTTDDLTEGDNLYYTLTRDDSAFDVRLATKTTDDLTEGDNLYYTLTRDDSAFDVRLTTKTTDDLTEGDNLYYLTSRFDSDLSNRTTDDLTEGDNLYYTLTRDDSAFDVRLATKTTDDLSEGDNLYYLTSRFDSDLITGLATKTTDDLTEGANRLYFTDARANAAAVLLIDSNYVSSRIDTGVTVFKAIVEIVSVQNGNTFELNASYGSVCYVPTITGAATVSIINVPTQLNVSQTFSFIIDNGLPAFLPTQLYINNVATSVRWLGGDVPTPTTNGTDVISYIIISGDTTPFSRVLANHAPYLD